MAKVTNVVFTAEMGCSLDLRHVVNSTTFIRYNPKHFSALIWSNPRMESTCLLFKNGKVVCTGAKTIERGRKSIRQYARKLQNLGYDIKLKNIRIRTISAVYTLQGCIKPEDLAYYLDAIYEPEVILAARLRRGGVHFTCWYSGKILITGVKSMEQLVDDEVSQTLLEIEVLSKSI